MVKNQDTENQGWGASFFSQTTEDVARSVVAAAATVRPRPSIVFSTKNQNRSSQVQKLHRQVSKVWKGWPFPGDRKIASYNPEVLTSQKRQWTRLQLGALGHKRQKEPTNLFENMVVVGLHPSTDVQAIEVSLTKKRPIEDTDGSERFLDVLRNQPRGTCQLHLEPQILVAYPPEKRLPLKHKDLISFCFPSGLECHLVERTPSMSELNEVLLGQEHLQRNDLSFVFRLKVANNATLYGCCMVVEELVQEPPGLMAMHADVPLFQSSLSRFCVSAPRCYCILSKMPFFNLHFGILKSIFTQERLDRITKSITELSLTSEDKCESNRFVQEDDTAAAGMPDGTTLTEEKNEETSKTIGDAESEHNRSSIVNTNENGILILGSEAEGIKHEKVGDQHSQLMTESEGSEQLCSKEAEDSCREIQEIQATKGNAGNGEATKNNLNGDIWPYVWHGCQQSSESTNSVQIPSINNFGEEFRSRILDDELETGEASTSGKESSHASDAILSWAKANNHVSLRIVCEYHRLPFPSRGSSLFFQPLEYLQPLTFQRFGDTELQIGGHSINLSSCKTSLDIAEVHATLVSEEEAQALSVWTVATICGVLPLDSVLAIFSAALLEKQIVVVCSNVGVLSAVVLSVIPLIRPFQWQSLLLPVLPNGMLEFLDAPVPYVVGVKNKTSEVRTKLPNVILVDVNKNQVRTPSIPQLPQCRELLSVLGPYHAKLVSEGYLAKRRPVYECTDAQAQAAEGFLAVLRSYLESICVNLRAHTITNVQSNDDKVSLLLKESFIDSFPSRDKPFMKLFVDTQLFSELTDTVLSLYQKE